MVFPSSALSCGAVTCALKKKVKLTSAEDGWPKRQGPPEAAWEGWLGWGGVRVVVGVVGQSG